MSSSRFCEGERGQTLVVLALTLTALIGFVGLVADIAWFEVNMIRVQRTADAAALAGVVYLPGDVTGAQTAALNEATKNGYLNGVNGVAITVSPDPVNDKILAVTASAPVRTFFSRLFGLASFTATRNARAEFILPVPMGSPENYFGINVLCRNSDTPPACPQVASATGIGNLAPLGFFGGVEARGTDRTNGDAYSTFYNPKPTQNTGFDVDGYSYIADFPAGTVGGNVYLYDPMFCATGAGTSTGRRLGVGDFWLGPGGNALTNVYNLWNMNGTPYTTTDDTLIATKTYVSNQVDKSTNYKGGGDYGGGINGTGLADCALNLAHNNWVLLQGGLAAGQYRLQVVTSSGSNNENGVNGFGIQVTSTSGPVGHVYGQSRMEALIVINNTSVFYLSQVEAGHAGKTLEIKLFDPGDIFSTTLKIRMPIGTSPGYVYAPFTWTADGSACGAATSGSGTSLATSSSSCTYYNNHWVTISVPIPITYATSPVYPGEPGPGWWKIEYILAGAGQDVTTWEVGIRGNPVHLITP